MRALGVLVALLGLAAIDPRSVGAQPPSYLYQWGSTGSGAGQFRSPTTAAVDANQYVYVADAYNNRIQKFSSSGAFVSQWTNSHWKGIDPTGVAVDAAGNVYVTSYLHVHVFSSSGTLVREWSEGPEYGMLIKAYGVAVGADGAVYVVDRNNDRVVVFSNNGAYLNQWGGSGNGAGQFANPHGIALDANGNVYVADTGNQRVQVFSSVGTYLNQWSAGGTPTGVAVDAGGTVYVPDYHGNRILTYTSSGTYLSEFGTEGAGDGQFMNPHGVAVDGNGNLYVVEASGDRVQVFGDVPTPVVNSTWGRMKASYRK